MSKVLFRLSYGVMHATPLYPFAAIALASYGAPAWMALAPIPLLFIPATLYLLSRRCPDCQEKLYTVEHLKRAPGGMGRFPLHVFRACPACGHAFPDVLKA